MTTRPMDAADPTTPDGGPAPVLRAAKAPVGTGSSPLFAQLIALGFVCLGAVGVQTLLVSLGAVAGPAWVLTAARSLDAIRGDSPPVLVVGVVALVLGLALLPVVVRRRPRRGLALRAETGVHLRPRDLARVAQAALDGVDSVTDVRVRANRRRLRADLTSVAARERRAEIKGLAEERLAESLGALERRPRVRITVHDEGS